MHNYNQNISVGMSEKRKIEQLNVLGYVINYDKITIMILK